MDTLQLAVRVPEGPAGTALLERKDSIQCQLEALLSALIIEEGSQVVDALNAFLDMVQKAKSRASAEVTGTADELAFAAELSERSYSRQERLQLELQALINAFEFRRELLEGAFRTADVSKLLSIHRQSVHDRLRRHELLAVYDNGSWRFPRWQFAAEGKDGVLNGLKEVLTALNASDLGKVSWFTTPNVELDGLTPLDAMKYVDDDNDWLERVVEAARTFGVS